MNKLVLRSLFGPISRMVTSVAMRVMNRGGEPWKVTCGAGGAGFRQRLTDDFSREALHA